MPGPLIAVCGVLGLAIGSFLNVVIWRVPRGESIVRPPSHCPSCSKPIAPRDNIPVVSWLLLRGRCRHCGEPISARYPMIEILTAVVFALLAWKIGPHVALIGFLWLGAVGVALSAIDIDLHRLPDALTLPTYGVALVVLGIAAAVAGNAWPFERAMIGGAALFAFYFAVVFAYPKGMGFGDVKLAGSLGMFLAWLGWSELAVGAFMAFLVGAVVSIALVMFHGAGRKTAVPFGPFMLLGALIGILAGGPLASGYTSLLHG